MRSSFSILPKVGYLGLAGFLLFACSGPAESPSAERQSEPNPTETASLFLSNSQWQTGNYQGLAMEKQSFGAHLGLTGQVSVAPAQRYTVSSFFGGTVSGLNLQNGDHVKAGEVLFYLEGPELLDLQKDYWESKAEWERAAANYRRQKELRADSIVSEKIFQETEAEYRRVQAQFLSFKEKLALLKLSEAQISDAVLLSRIPVRAPGSGIVSDLAVSSGFHLAANQTALLIYDMSKPLLELNVFEKDLDKLQINQAIRYRLQSSPSVYYPAVLKQLSANFSANGAARAYAELDLDSLPKTLAFGMYVEAESAGAEVEYWSLPENAVAERNGQFYALRLMETTEGKSLEAIELKLGPQWNGRVSVLNYKAEWANFIFLDHNVFRLLEE